METRSRTKELLQEINRLLIEQPSSSDGFLGGSLGTIYYFFQYCAKFEDDEIETRARQLLDEYVDNLSNNKLKLDPFSYCNGLAGFAYAMIQLDRAKSINIDIKEEFADIDQMLFESAMTLIEADKTDFLHGAFGIVHYFSNRTDDPLICSYLDKLINLLIKKMMTVNGLSFIPNLSLPSNQVKEKVNLSLSHGLNGFVLILLKLVDKPVEQTQISYLIQECSKVLFHSVEDMVEEKKSCSTYPVSMSLKSGERKYSNRLGWCYGDLGQLLLLHKLQQLGLLSKKQADYIDALAVATVSRKSPADTLIEDSSFCHGAAGLAQFYAGLQRISADTIYSDAYDFWINETLNLLSQDLEAGKFSNNEHSILDGYTGIGLTLLNYLSPNKCSWEEAVLLA